MGAPKQKWTAEEEAALKAGVVKHGAGKWRTILKDPDFSGVLHQRSNVDLKDKWRNMSVMANGWGSRDRARLALKRVPQASKQDGNAMVLNTEVQSKEDITAAKPLAISGSIFPTEGPKRTIIRLDNLIIEAVTRLKEPGGSNKTTIATYIEDQYCAPPNFKRLLSAKLKFLTSSGKLIKVKRKYRIAPTSEFSDKRRNSSMLVMRGKQSACPEEEDLQMPTRAEIDLELEKMRLLSPREAAEEAARAVAQAETAMAEAEAAAREAAAAEAEAEAAQAFAEAAMKALNGRNSKNMVTARV